MKVWGVRVPFTKAAVGASDVSMLRPDRGGGWYGNIMGAILEPFSGAWQKNVKHESPRNIIAFAAVYAAIALISQDIAKMRVKLVEQLASGIWREVRDRNSPYHPILRKPNAFQTRVQFFAQWLASLLLYGNTYVLIERNAARIPVAMFVLDPRNVTPAIAPDGSVWYQLKGDNLAGIGNEVTIPSREIIHDRMNAFFHPLIGISPIYACGASATQGIRLQANATNFAENQNRPSGILTTPAILKDAQLAEVKTQWDRGFTGANAGKVAVLGGGMEFKPMTIAAVDAQLIEQLRWTVEDVARAFNLPLHKLASGQAPAMQNTGVLNQDYYAQCLQIRVESIEILLDEGLGLDKADAEFTLGTEFDLEGLLRMDPKARAETDEIRIRSGSLSPNESRLGWDLEPVDGGDSPMMQQQNWSLAALAERPPPSESGAPTAGPAAAKPEPEPAANDDDADQAAAKFMAALVSKFATAEHA